MRPFLARLRIGLTSASSWLAPVNFAMIYYLFLLNFYGKHGPIDFREIPFALYVFLGFLPFLLGLGLFAWESQGRLYEEEIRRNWRIGFNLLLQDKALLEELRFKLKAGMNHEDQRIVDPLERSHGPSGIGQPRLFHRTPRRGPDR